MFTMFTIRPCRIDIMALSRASFSTELKQLMQLKKTEWSRTTKNRESILVNCKERHRIQLNYF